MTRYLPDSSILIRYARGHEAERDWFRAMLNSGEDVGSCPITIAECLAGAAPPERAGWAELFQRLTFWPVEPSDAALAGVWKFDYARRGIQLALPDLLIASVAYRVGAVLVTNNAKDFPMPDVRVQPFP